MEEGTSKPEPPIPHIKRVPPLPQATCFAFAPTANAPEPSEAHPAPATSPANAENTAQPTISQPPLKGASGGGPRTPFGKENSSKNALKDGLTAKKHMMLRLQDPAIYASFRERIWAEQDPQGPTEEDYVNRYIRAAWLVKRAQMLRERLDDFLYQQNPAHYAAPAGVSEEEAEDDEDFRIFKEIANVAYDGGDADVTGQFQRRIERLNAEMDKAHEKLDAYREMRKRNKKRNAPDE